jgi:hypothetical protein
MTPFLAVQIVQFAGKCIVYDDAKEWNVTHAILSNSLAVSSAETRLKRNEQVDEVMARKQLVHIGWLRQASKSCPLSSLDLDTQRVRFCSVAHLLLRPLMWTTRDLDPLAELSLPR